MKVKKWNVKSLLLGVMFIPLAYADRHVSVAAHGGHDMSAMQQPAESDGSEMTAMEEVVTESRTPIPPVADKDRMAAFGGPQGKMAHGGGINTFVLIDRFEAQRSSNDSLFNWSINSWMGGDIDRLWFKSEGEKAGGKTQSAEARLLWGHAVGPWWDLVAGVRQDFRPAAPQTWGAVGFQGLALYNFESEVTAFVGNGGRTALRIGGEYDVLLTNRLILQPSYEVNFYSRNDEARGVGKGLSDTELGLRLRYEIRREIAPYIGISWTQLYGTSADFAKNEGEKDGEFVFLAGARVWF